MFRLNLTNTQLHRVESLGFVAQWVLVGCATWNLLQAGSPGPNPATPRLTARTGEEPAPTRPPASLTAAQLQEIWERDLRQTLIEPQPKKAPEPKPPPAPPPVKLPTLVATFVENGKAWGLFVEKSGSHRVRAASHRTDGFDILQITPGAARLRRGHRTYDVYVPMRPTGLPRPGDKRGRRR